MKKILFISIAVMIFLSFGSVNCVAAGYYLACDIPTETITDCEVKVDGVVQTTHVACFVDGSDFLLFDITGAGYEGSQHTYEARWSEDNGASWSTWSLPFATGLNAPSNVRKVYR